MENGPKENTELESLEAAETDKATVTNPDGTSSVGPKNTDNKPPSSKKQSIPRRMQQLITHVNVYLLVFVLILLIAIVVVVVGVQRSRKSAGPTTVTPQELDQEALKNLNGSETKVGDPKQTLSIESNAIFSGKVLVRDSLDVAGTIKVGGALNLSGITVSGTSNFDQVQAKRLAVAGETAIQGTLSLQKNLTVSGGGSFGGAVSAPQLNVQSLQLSGDLAINRHIDAGGPTPGASNGSALGAGGTASVSGTDTAGTVTINTGGGPGAGCFITINFATRFSGTPHVVIAPVGSAAAGLSYYINRSTTGFSICTTSPAPASQNFAFDYIVID